MIENKRSIGIPLIEYWKKWEGSIICEYTGKKWNSGELHGLSDSIVDILKERGLSSGDNVGMALTNTVAFPAVMVALLSIECNPLLINASATEEEMYSISCKFDLKYIIHDSVANVSRLNKHSLLKFCSFHFQCNKVELHFLDIKQATNSNGGTYFGKGVFLHPTSGTYGKSSYCVRSQMENVAEAINYLERISIYNRSSVMVLTPLHHAFGFGFGLISSILSDSNLILFPAFNPKIVLKNLKTEIIDILAIVPPMLSSMVMIPEESGYRMAKSVFYAGTPCPVALSERFLSVFNTKLYQIYGTTETGAIATSYFNGDVLPGVGKCLPNVEVGIFKDSTYERLGENIGEVLIKSNSMMDCYTHYTIRKSDFWHTGDIGFFDSFNNLHLTSRVKDIINVGGSKVDPVEIEKVLLEHNLIIDAVAYPYIREDGKEMVQAAVVLRDSLISESELSRFCFEKISEYKVPVFFHFVDLIPRTSSGKIKKMDLPDFPKKILFEDPEKLK